MLTDISERRERRPQDQRGRREFERQPHGHRGAERFAEVHDARDIHTGMCAHRCQCRTRITRETALRRQSRIAAVSAVVKQKHGEAAC